MKRILKIIIMLAFSCGLYLYAGIVLSPKSTNDIGGSKYYQGYGFLSEDKNTVDMLAIGNSDLYSGFSPMELYSKYGYTSYNTGISHNSLADCFDIIKEFERKQDLKVLMIEADFLYNIDDKGKKKTINPKHSFLTAPFFYHSRWKDIKLRDFYTLPSYSSNYDYMKGYIHSTTINNCLEYKDYMKEKNKNKGSMHKNTAKMFDKLISLMKKKDVKIFVTVFPTPYSWSEDKSLKLEALCKKYELPLIDFNTNDTSKKIDFEKDFRDDGNHLNYFGMKKMMDVIGQYIKNNNLLESHKDDENFSKWDTSLVNYLKTIKNGQL